MTTWANNLMHAESAILDHLKRIEQKLDQNTSQKLAYTIPQAAEACSVTENTIRTALADGSLRAKKRGRKWLITRDALIEWLP